MTPGSVVRAPIQDPMEITITSENLSGSRRISSRGNKRRQRLMILVNEVAGVEIEADSEWRDVEKALEISRQRPGPIGRVLLLGIAFQLFNYSETIFCVQPDSNRRPTA